MKKKPKSPKRSGPVTMNEKQSKANSVKGEPTTEFEKEANEGMGNIKIDEEPDIKELLGNTNGWQSQNSAKHMKSKAAEVEGLIAISSK